jgi:hypothetical protein
MAISTTLSIGYSISVAQLGEGGWELAEFFDRSVLDGHRYASQDEVLEDIWIKYSTDNLLGLSSDRWSTIERCGFFRGGDRVCPVYGTPYPVCERTLGG